MDKGFLYRRLCAYIPCVLKSGEQTRISLSNKHQIASFQDVYLNTFYWEALLALSFKPTIIFDLGANFGLFSSLCNQVMQFKFENFAGQFFLVEANQRLIKYLHKNKFSLFSNDDVQLIYGLAGPNIDSSFKENSQNFLASKISTDGVTVPFIDFNQYPTPSLLKIDIEGAETLLFKNYFNWLSGAKAIIIEFDLSDEERLPYEQMLLSCDFELLINRSEKSGFQNQLWVRKES